MTWLANESKKSRHQAGGEDSVLPGVETLDWKDLGVIIRLSRPTRFIARGNSK